MASRVKRDAVEVNLVEHCNLSCGGCDHASPHLAEKFASFEQVAADLRAVARHLELDEIKLLGGEPLLHPQLVDFMKLVKTEKLASRLTVVTNGLLLHKVDPVFWTLVNRVWISVYPGVKYKVDLADFKTIAEQHRVELWVKETPSFTKTLLNKKNEDRALVADVYERCDMAHVHSCHTVHEGRYYKCAPAPFVGSYQALLGVAFDNRVDGVPLHDNPTLGEDLLRYLADPQPLASCSYCLGSVGVIVPANQLNKARRAAELAEDHSDPRALISADALASGCGQRSDRKLKTPGWVAGKEPA